jgi:hypothetical protein
MPRLHAFSITRLAEQAIRRSIRYTRRYQRNSDGVTAIEFAIVGLPFFLIILGILELGLAFFVNRILDNAVLETARVVRTGQAHQASFSADDFKDDICANLPGFLCDPNKFIVDVTTFDTFSDLDNMETLFDEDGDLKEDFSYDIGCASSIVVARVVYRWPMFTALLQFDGGDTGGSERLLYSTAIFRNEPFPWSCS